MSSSRAHFPAPIVYVSNASWHYGLPTNRQQLPKRLANHTPVLYSSPFSLSQVLLRRVSIRQYRTGLREESPNLYLFDNLRILPMVRGQVWPLNRLDEWLCASALKRHAQALGFAAPILWLYFPPSFQHLIGKLGECLTCYHCTDDHLGYAEALGLDRKQVEEDETRLLKAVDLVFVTSRPLYERKIQHNPHTYLMPNVADVDHFFPVSQGTVGAAPEMAHLPRPIAGFVGAVDSYKLDLDLIDQVVQMLADWSFVFIGPVGTADGTSVADLPKHPNLHFLGARPYSELPRYLAGFDVCMIPYRLNRYTTGVFPLKFWEYFASGRPVVITPLPALADHYQYVEVGDSPGAFALALRRALATSTQAAVRQRLTLASEQSWEKRAAEMLHILQEHLQ